MSSSGFHSEKLEQAGVRTARKGTLVGTARTWHMLQNPG